MSTSSSNNSSNSNSNNKAALEAAVLAMTTDSRSLFDVTIICTTDDFQAEYWMKRLSEGLCYHHQQTTDHNTNNTNNTNNDKSPFPMVLAVSEDWGPGGAGNGLGTLYAFQKATILAKNKYYVDLPFLLTNGTISAALYHTAGKGTRLAPLPASENNNKPGVKLPVCRHTMTNDNDDSSSSYQPVTVLEAVIQQTSIYAASRKGRLSVFWGDQIFVPSAPYVYTPTHHIDILCTLLGDTAPTSEEWTAQGLDKYGVIAVFQKKNIENDNDGQQQQEKEEERGNDAAQVEKVSHSTAMEMLQSLGDIGQVGPSLGSFSISATMLQALTNEFALELADKTAKLDTDPDFWMPMTLSSHDYASLMKQKGIDETVSVSHHERMTRMKETFDFGPLGLFGAVDVGSDACWWDYGQLKLYSKNNLKLLETDHDADLLRQFFGIVDKKANSTFGDNVTVDDSSCVFGCHIIKGGSIVHSTMANVTSPYVEADGAIIINCTANKIVASKGSILYNLIDTSEEGIVATPGQVIVKVTKDASGDSFVLSSHMDIDGKTAWSTVLEGNPMSFEQVHEQNFDSNVTAIEQVRAKQYAEVAASFYSV